MKIVCGAAALTFAMFALPVQRAAAEDTDFTVGAYAAFGGGLVAAVSIPFLVADIAYAAQGRWLPPEWAIWQMLLGGGVNGWVAISGLSLWPNVWPVTVGASVLSLWFIAHAVASLVLYETGPPEKGADARAHDSRSALLPLVPDVVVTSDGDVLIALRRGF